MEIRPVDNRIQFNGHVHKSMKKLVNKTVESVCSKLKEQGVNSHKIAKVQEYGDKILNKYEKFMSELHEDTVLYYKNTNLGNFSGNIYSEANVIALKNPISAYEITLADGISKTKYASIYPSYKRRKMGLLVYLNKLADKLMQKGKTHFNDEFLSLAEYDFNKIPVSSNHSFIRRFSNLCLARKIDKYACAIKNSRHNHAEELKLKYTQAKIDSKNSKNVAKYQDSSFDEFSVICNRYL